MKSTITLVCLITLARACDGSEPLLRWLRQASQTLMSAEIKIHEIRNQPQPIQFESLSREKTKLWDASRDSLPGEGIQSSSQYTKVYLNSQDRFLAQIQGERKLTEGRVERVDFSFAGNGKTFYSCDNLLKRAYETNRCPTLGVQYLSILLMPASDGGDIYSPLKLTLSEFFSIYAKDPKYSFDTVEIDSDNAKFIFKQPAPEDLESGASLVAEIFFNKQTGEPISCSRTMRSDDGSQILLSFVEYKNYKGIGSGLRLPHSIVYSHVDEVPIDVAAFQGEQTTTEILFGKLFKTVSGTLDVESISENTHIELEEFKVKSGYLYMNGSLDISKEIQEDFYPFRIE